MNHHQHETLAPWYRKPSVLIMLAILGAAATYAAVQRWDQAGSYLPLLLLLGVPLLFAFMHGGHGAHGGCGGHAGHDKRNADATGHGTHDEKVPEAGAGSAVNEARQGGGGHGAHGGPATQDQTGYAGHESHGGRSAHGGGCCGGKEHAGGKSVQAEGNPQGSACCGGAGQTAPRATHDHSAAGTEKR